MNDKTRFEYFDFDVTNDSGLAYLHVVRGASLTGDPELRLRIVGRDLARHPTAMEAILPPSTARDLGELLVSLGS